MIFDKYPYTNFHEMNDDWLIQTLREFGQQLDEFVAVNSLTYADPIAYDPASIYPANTVVIYNGTAYVSKQAVPSGMLPGADSEYWLSIFPFGELIEQQINEYLLQAQEQITAAINTLPNVVNDWMEANPDVITTVQDGAISWLKLNDNLRSILLAGYAETSVINIDDFEQGAIDITTGDDAISSYMCRTTGFLQFPDGIALIRTMPDFQIQVFQYALDGTYEARILPLVQTTFQPFITDANHKYRVSISYDNLATLTPADLPLIPVACSIYQTEYADADAVMKSAIASEYSSASTYNVGDYVFHSDTLYRCVTDITTAESFTAAHWAAVALADEVSDLKSQIDSVTTLSTQIFNKNDAETEHWVISNNAVHAATYTTSVIIPVNPSASDEYITVHRNVITSRFTVATFTAKPEIESVPVTSITQDSSSSITVVCSTAIKYIMVVFHHANDDASIAIQTVLDGLMVQFGSVYTGYEPYSFRVIIPEKSVNGNSFSDNGVAFIADMVDEITADAQLLAKSNTETVTSKTDNALVWTEGSYYNLNTGEITALSGRAYSAKVDCKAGDRISVTNNKGQILFWKEDGSYYGYLSTDYPTTMTYLVPSDVAKFALNNSDSTIRATSATIRTDSTDIIANTYNAPAKLIYDETMFETGKYCSVSNGKIANVASYSCLPFVPVKSNHNYRTQTQTQVVFYDSSLAFISALLPGGAASNTGVTVEMDFTTPSTCRYISVNTLSEHEMLFDLDYTVAAYVDNPQKLHGLTVLSFGDSIMGNYAFGDNIIYEVEKFCGAKTYCCGFGGCRMEKISVSGSAAEIAALTNPFAMCELVDQLALPDTDPDKWAAQDAAAAQFEASPRYNKIIKFRLNILKAINIADIDIITIAYGTNETGYPQENPNDPYDKYTFGGATRYSIRKLLELNPELRIVLLTPIYRHSFNSGSGDSDSYVNPDTNLGMADNINTLKAVGAEFKIPVIDMYHDLGINKETYLSYFGDEDEPEDGTHINSFGRKQYGVRLAGELSRLF